MSQRSILLAHHDIIKMNPYVKSLREDGLEVHTSMSHNDLMSILEEHSFKFNLLILELSIPQLSVSDLISYIEMNASKEIPIIGIANYETDVPILDDCGDQFSMVLETGFDFTDFANAVEGVLRISEGPQRVQLTEEQMKERAQNMTMSETIVLDRHEIGLE